MCRIGPICQSVELIKIQKKTNGIAVIFVVSRHDYEMFDGAGSRIDRRPPADTLYDSSIQKLSFFCCTQRTWNCFILLQINADCNLYSLQLKHWIKVFPKKKLWFDSKKIVLLCEMYEEVGNCIGSLRLPT